MAYFQLTVVARSKTPFAKLLGTDIAKFLETLITQHAITLLTGTSIVEIYANVDNDLERVKLSDGSVIECNVLIVAAGTRPNTQFLNDSGISMNKDGTVNCDTYCRSNIEDIFVGGDIANAPIFAIDNELGNCRYLKVAQYHGRIAGRNMSRIDSMEREELRCVPQYFTSVFGRRLRYAGHGEYVDVYIDGKIPDMNFAAYYINREEFVVAVATIGRDPLAAQFAELLYQHKRLHRCDVLGKPNTTDWTQMIKTRPRC